MGRSLNRSFAVMRCNCLGVLAHLGMDELLAKLNSWQSSSIMVLRRAF